MGSDYNEKLELTALYEISKILGSSLNLKANLKSIMKVLSEYLDMKRGTVAIKSDDVVSIFVAHGMTEDEIKKGKYSLGEGIIGRVAKYGMPIVIPNIGEEPLFLNKTGTRRIKKENISFLCVPIKLKGEVLGVLSVDRLFSSKGVSFEKDLRVLKIIASLIAQSVKLYYDVEKEKNALIEERNALKNELKGKYKIKNIIGQSDRMLEIFESIQMAAPSNANILLLGESGTGKELVAKAIHYMSPRANGPFIKINCASIPDGLLESELFGHEKGAFTGALFLRKGKFELADKGTIFLDEVGDLPLALQPKILRVLQEREFERIGGEKTIKVDVRVIAATSKDLERLVNEGKFREDLYYRLNVIPIILPPLRERKEDIPLLLEHFLKKYNEENRKSISLSSEVIDLFKEYDWPGNVRELENTIERLVIMSKGNSITISDIPISIKNYSLRQKIQFKAEDKLPVIVDEIEREKIIEALKKTGGNKSRAAKILGITPRQIGYKIKKLNIDI